MFPSHSPIGSAIAAIKQLYIYPVKSMRGVAVQEAHLGLNGIYGDRRYAFVRKDLAASDSFPWMTGRQKPRMILYSPRFARPPTFDDFDPPILVAAPDGGELSITDSRLQAKLESEYGHALMLLKNGRGNFDSQHLSLFSLMTLQMLSMESNCEIDHRQFRANIYLEPSDNMPFSENDWIGSVLKIGHEAIIGITKKDTRCMMINLDPESAVQHPQVLRTVARNHDEQAGIYANVMMTGVIRVGDPIRVLTTMGVSQSNYAD